MKQLLIPVLLIYHVAAAQETSQDIRLPERKRFIDKVEVFAGPGLSFNYGNKFVENYKDDNVQNRRLLKIGYTFGVGLYHPVSDKIDINARLLFEQKGSKAELNLPIYMGRLKIDSEYNYRFLTLALAPRVSLDGKKRMTLSVGGYYSNIKGVKGQEKVYHSRDQTTSVTSFTGRSLRGLDNNGGVVTLTYIPGLRSFEKYDYGITVGLGYLFKIKKDQVISVQVIDNLGLQNINKLTDGNFVERNHIVSFSVGYIIKR